MHIFHKQIINLRNVVNYSLRATDFMTVLLSKADSMSGSRMLELLFALPLADPWSGHVPNWLSVTSLWKTVTVHVKTTEKANVRIHSLKDSNYIGHAFYLPFGSFGYLKITNLNDWKLFTSVIFASDAFLVTNTLFNYYF